MSLNVGKPHSMLVCTDAERNVPQSSSQSLEVKPRRTELKVVNKSNCLRVELDNSLDWKDQVQAVSLQVSRGPGLLKYAQICLTFSALTSRYSYYIEWCSVVTEEQYLCKLVSRTSMTWTRALVYQGCMTLAYGS